MNIFYKAIPGAVLTPSVYCPLFDLISPRINTQLSTFFVKTKSPGAKSRQIFLTGLTHI